jgi:hypothetical protein
VQSSRFSTEKRLNAEEEDLVPDATIGGLGVDVMDVYDRSGGSAVTGLLFFGLFDPVVLRSFATCLLVDHGFSRLAFCITKERAFRRPCCEPLADLEASTKRKSC